MAELCSSRSTSYCWKACRPTGTSCLSSPTSSTRAHRTRFQTGTSRDPEFVMKRTSFIVMPFLPRDLAHALQSEKNAGNRIPADRARRIIIDILSAVQHLQAHRVAHCDLRPENVMLQNVKTDHEVAVVTDFGCSKDFTVRMSPQMFPRRKARSTHRASGISF